MLANSSNIGAIHIGMQVGNANMYDYIKRFGFGPPDRNRAAGGSARDWFGRFAGGGPAPSASIAMGHEISVTSVQLAQAGAMIANGGFLVHPHVVLYEQAPGGREGEAPRPNLFRYSRPKRSSRCGR